MTESETEAEYTRAHTHTNEIGNILLLICGNPDELYFNDEPFAFDEKVSFFCLHKSMI